MQTTNNMFEVEVSLLALVLCVFRLIYLQGVSGRKLVMTGGTIGGALLTNDDDRIIRQWKWDRQRQNAGKVNV
jgi:hypothetical protein